MMGGLFSWPSKESLVINNITTCAMAAEMIDQSFN